MANKTTQLPKGRENKPPVTQKKATSAETKASKTVSPPTKQPKQAEKASAPPKKSAATPEKKIVAAPLAQKVATPTPEGKGKRVEGIQKLSKNTTNEVAAAKVVKPQPAKAESKKADVKPAEKPVATKPLKEKSAPVAEKAVSKAATKPSAAESVKAPERTTLSPEIMGDVRPPSGKPCKILPREFLVELSAAIRDAVYPHVREARGREVVGSATSGDATFALDKVAEKALLQFLKTAKLPVAYYSEDAGYTTFTNAQPLNLLIIDPIDGTRAAKSGFESCVVSVASSRVIERPCMADVDNACIMEIAGPRTFYAERGKGVRITMDDHTKRTKLSHNTNLETMVWSMTVPARPAELIFPAASRLIDVSSLKGGFFACNSTSYSLTRLITNQLDAAVDVANRFLRDIPELVRDIFINAGRGVTMGIAPYDVAASLLIAREAGCIVTDAYGKTLDHALLLDSSPENHMSLVAAANAELHAKLLKYFDTRIHQIEDAWRRKAEIARAQQAVATAK